MAVRGVNAPRKAKCQKKPSKSAIQERYAYRTDTGVGRCGAIGEHRLSTLVPWVTDGLDAADSMVASPRHHARQHSLELRARGQRLPILD